MYTCMQYFSITPVDTAVALYRPFRVLTIQHLEWEFRLYRSCVLLSELHAAIVA